MKLISHKRVQNNGRCKVGVDRSMGRVPAHDIVLLVKLGMILDVQCLAQSSIVAAMKVPSSILSLVDQGSPANRAPDNKSAAGQRMVSISLWLKLSPRTANDPCAPGASILARTLEPAGMHWC